MCESLVEVGCDGHLLVQLRRLGQVGRTFEIRDFEDIGSALAGRRDDLGCVDLHKPSLGEVVPEQHPHPGLQPEDGLVGGGAEVQHPVVQPRVLVHPGEVPLLVLGQLPPSVLYLQRQLGVAVGHNPNLK